MIFHNLTKTSMILLYLFTAGSVNIQIFEWPEFLLILQSLYVAHSVILQTAIIFCFYSVNFMQQI